MTVLKLARLKTQFVFKILLLCTVLVVNSGFTFGRAKLHKSIGSFTEAATVSIASVREFYAGVNDFYRWAYLETAKVSIGAGSQIGEISNEQPTGLKRKIPDEYIRPRLDLLDALGKYSSNLAELAGSDAPDKAAKAIEESGKHISQISAQINTLKNSSSAAKLDIDKYTTPITKLAAILTREGMDWKRNRDLKKNIKEAAPFVKEACGYLADDTELLVPSVYDKMIDQVLSGYITYYNNYMLTKGVPDKDLAPYRQTMLNDICSLEERRLALVQTNPKAAIEKLANLHEKIVDVVLKREHGPTLADITEDINAFTQLAKEVSESVFDLREAFSSHS